MKEWKKENGNALKVKTERGMKENPQGSGAVGSAEFDEEKGVRALTIKENGRVVSERAEESESKPQEGGSTLGKFKDANALLQAYLALEAEFTRRSQRLKALEKEWEKRESEKAYGEAGQTAEPKLVEEGGDPEIQPAAECATEAEERVEPSPELEQTPAQTEVCGAGTVDGESTVEYKERTLPESDLNREKQVTDDEALYSAALANETVRLRIIGEYLHSIAVSGAPVVKGGAGKLAVAAKKAESISSAGEMALRMFQSSKRKV